MREQAEKLRLTLDDGGRAYTALKEVLKSELYTVFRQYMRVDDVIIEKNEHGLVIKILGDDFKKIGFYSG